MLRGFYSAATALNAATVNQDMIAQNLAHLNVPGYRRAIQGFETFETSLHRVSTNSELGANAVALSTDFSPGPLEQTGRSLDLAIDGEGFFVLQGPQGPLYTRNGTFQLGGDGHLKTSDGLLVEGIGGPISAPNDASEADIQIGRDGSVHAQGVLVGQLQIVQFDDHTQLVRAGTTTFEAPPELVPEASEANVLQGARELSNVSAVDELVRMISGLRYFELSQRALRTLGEAVQHHTNPGAG